MISFIIHSLFPTLGCGSITLVFLTERMGMLRARRILGIILLLIAPYLLFVAAGLISEPVQHATAAEVHDHLKGTTIAFYVGRTNTTFNGDCVPLRWEVEGGSVGYIYVSGAPSMGSGSVQHCDGTEPSLRIVYDDGTSHTWVIPVHATFDEPAAALRAWLWIAPSILCALAGVLLSGSLHWQVLRRPIVQYVLALAFAIAFVFVLDLFTNSLNIYRYYWDHTQYIDMAEHGVLRNPGLVAPYAYRPVVPLLAAVISRLANRSLLGGFRLIVYAGTISQLLLVFFLARQFTRKTWIPWVVMLVIAISTYHVKFLLFDIFRPDSLAYSLILIGMWALFKRNRFIISSHLRASNVEVQRAGTTTRSRDRRSSALPHPPPLPEFREGLKRHGDADCSPSPNSEREMEGEVFGKHAHHAIVYQYQHAAPLQNRTYLYDLIIVATSAFGLLVREFCIIPGALLAFHLLQEYRQTRQRSVLIGLILVVIVFVIAYGLPRQVIIVGRSDQFLDDRFSNVFNIVANVVRNFNIVLGGTVYLLPLLVLLTRDRAQRIWARLAPLRTDLIFYSLIILGLAMLGGSDIARFTAYLFVPLIIVLIITLDEGIHPVEIAYMLLAAAVFNRLLSPVPMQDIDAYLDFYIVWGDRTSTAEWLRALELLIWIGGAFLLRRQLKKPSNRTDQPNTQVYSA
jgi:hypothetical protein